MRVEPARLRTRPPRGWTLQIAFGCTGVNQRRVKILTIFPVQSLIDLTGEYFQAQGTNGRSCTSCHIPANNSA